MASETRESQPNILRIRLRFKDVASVEVRKHVIYVTAFDEFAVLSRRELEEGLNVLKSERKAPVILRCISEKLLWKLIGDSQLIVLPLTNKVDMKPPPEMFEKLRQVATLSVKEVCGVSDEALKKYALDVISEALKGFPDINDFTSLKAVDPEIWATLYVAGVTPSEILFMAERKVKSDLEQAKDPERIKAISENAANGYYILYAISIELLFNGPAIIPVYVAERLLLPGVPEFVTIELNDQVKVYVNLNEFKLTVFKVHPTG